jgi:hypothetical protein
MGPLADHGRDRAPKHSSTLICCRKTRISASSATRDRSRPITIPRITLHKSNIEQQHRPILDQPPAGWSLRQGQQRVTGRLWYYSH